MNSTHSLMMLSNKLILGSQSPRRKELLEKAGFEFEVRSMDFEETYPDEMSVLEVAEYLSVEKNKALRTILENQIIITADTVVISNGRILEKPTDENDAITMLSGLSGQIHEVVTGVCISNGQKQRSISVTTEVKVKPLSIKEINYYITNYKPFDKAGAYGIQEWFGLIAIEWINGSYYNVVGLPVDQVYTILTEEFS